MKRVKCNNYHFGIVNVIVWSNDSLKMLSKKKQLNKNSINAFFVCKKLIIFRIAEKFLKYKIYYNLFYL